jgi:hypothetical protein
MAAMRGVALLVALAAGVVVFAGTTAAASRPVCTVPKLTGRTASAAKAALRRAGCPVSVLRTATTCTRAAKVGIVVKQKPAARARLEKGQKVTVHLGKSCPPAPLPPPAPKPNTNPRFSVEAVSTIIRHHVQHTAAAPQANGCVFHVDADATEQITTELARPAVLTYNDLLAGVKPFAVLMAEETRGGYYTYGFQDGCPLLAQSPRYVSDTSGCGTESFKIVSDGTAVGFNPGTHQFGFSWLYDSRDPFDGFCVHDVFATNDIGDAAGLSISIPPLPWQSGPNATPGWTSVDPSSLLTGKPVVVHYQHTGTVGSVTPPGGAPPYNEIGDTYSVSWTVTLTPVQGS